MKKRIYIGADHAGFELKKKLIDFLVKELKYEVVDVGPYSYDENDDYPDYVISCARKVARSADENSESVGIVIGGSGQGEAIAANKVKGIRCCVYYGGDKKIITLSKEHNDANVLSLGARFISTRKAKNVVKLWLETKFEKEDRHVRRLGKIREFKGKRW